MRGLLAALLGLAALAAVPSEAVAWSEPRTVLSTPYGADLSLAFNARGDALLTAHDDTVGHTLVRPAGGRFGKPRRYRTLFTHDAPRGVLDMDRGALLVGSWYHRAPELEHPESRDECCYRVFARRISAGGRAGKAQLLTPYGVESFLYRVESDERGRAGLVFNRDSQLSAALRRPGGAVGEPYPIERLQRASDFEVAVRPDGRGVAAWSEYDEPRVAYAPIARDGTLGRDQTVFLAPAGRRAILRTLTFGRRGHAWLLWEITDERSATRDVLYVARRAADGSFGSVRRLGRGAESVAPAVDDAGNLTVAWEDDRYVYARFFSRGGRVGATRRLGPGRLAGGPVVAAGGPGGRTVVAWELSHRRGGGRFSSELWAVSGRAGRFGSRRLVARTAVGNTFGEVTLGMSRRGATILAWNQEFDRGRDQVRYSVLAP